MSELGIMFFIVGLIMSNPGLAMFGFILWIID